ncbi:MAG: hypothetical protein ACOYOV_07365 [Bacteroidales bacterium]
MKKIIYYGFVFIALCSCNHQSNKNKETDVLQTEICKCKGLDNLNHAVLKYEPMLEYLDTIGVLKGNLVCFKDTISIEGLKCYTKEGFPVIVSDCYSTMNNDVELLLKTNRKPSKAKNVLRDYLCSNNIEYANGEKVTFDSLPKCKYIFVSEFAIGLYEAIPIKQYIIDLAKIIRKSETSILIFVHPKKPIKK